MTRRVLITGGSGFVGQWLSKHLLARGAMVYAGGLEGRPSSGALSASERDAVHWITLDMASADSVARAVAESAPEDVVHLAGIAYPPEANATPAHTYDVNALGAARLLYALEPGKGSTLRMLIVGTAEQYGAHSRAECPLPETAALLPLTPYGGSKAAQELISLQIARGTGLHVVCTRSFNHSGPGHAESYLLPSLVRRARKLPRRGGSLAMGNLTPVRDYLHVADVVRAYVLLLERGVAGEIYNVSSGHGVTIRELAERVLQRLGVSATIVEDPTLVRPSDVPILVGDSSKLELATGWRPELDINNLIDDLIHAAAR
jgi:GDP-4-dehydro-6-deoxy-D-mannose reductase